MKDLDKPIIHFKFPQDLIGTDSAHRFMKDLYDALGNKAYIIISTADMQVYGTEGKEIDVDKCSVSELFRILDETKKNTKEKTTKSKSSRGKRK